MKAWRIVGTQRLEGHRYEGSERKVPRVRRELREDVTMDLADAY